MERISLKLLKSIINPKIRVLQIALIFGRSYKPLGFSSLGVRNTKMRTEQKDEDEEARDIVDAYKVRASRAWIIENPQKSSSSQHPCVHGFPILG